ncbi:MAG: hypothetical protein WCG94_08605 [Methanothrix sp.]
MHRTLADDEGSPGAGPGMREPCVRQGEADEALAQTDALQHQARLEDLSPARTK